MTDNKDYQKYKFLSKKNFVITNLETTITTKKSKYENTTFSIIMAAAGIMILLLVLTLNTVTDITGLHPIIVVIVYIIITVLIVWTIIAYTQLNIRETIRERTLSGDDNVKFDLSNSWRIMSGGIAENVDIGLKSGTMQVTYDTKAIYIKGIMRGTVDLSDGDDWTHYHTLQKLHDIALKNGYELIKINMPYDTDNDPIWDNETDKIHKAQDLGDNYLTLRTGLHKMVYDFTKEYNTVTVTYFIFKATLAARLQPNVLAMEIIRLRQHTVMELSGINMTEFKMLLEHYYGVTISIEDILSFMTIMTSNLGECRLISYTLSNGTEVVENAIFDYKIPTLFTSNEMHTGYVSEEVIVEESKEIVIEHETGDIFSRDYV